MFNAHSKRQKDIKSKLMAAICMLLVSSIMMVSTTYAWFTLSTAPEVTGINTAVGANGNLEMALLPLTGSTADIKSEAGDSNKDLVARNVTWGNLVSLAKDGQNLYGMEKIKLYPAALNYLADGQIDKATPLQTPAYGADGRISQMLKNGVTGIYNSTEQDFFPDTQYGVRAVGVASGMTPRQLDYRNAQSAGNTNAAQAKTVAAQSLNANGAKLANIAIQHANTPDATYTQADIASLKNAVNELLGTTDKTGALEHIEIAYMQYILAYAASAATGADDTIWTGVKAAVTAETATLNSVVTAIGASMPSELAANIETLNTAIEDVTEAGRILDGLTGDAITWEQLLPALKLLANPETMTVNGYKTSEIKANMSDLVNKVLASGLTVTIASGGGVYADIADFCGDYHASVAIEKIEYGGLAVGPVTARMQTASNQTTSYLTGVAGVVSTAGAPASATDASMPISEFYGYVLDLAFRTNATESKLLLQVDGVDRIYDENTNDDTLGGGSTMTFAATTTDFSNEQIVGLMSAIRIVFFDTDSGTIMARGKLDTAEGKVNQTADGMEAKMYLYTPGAAAETTYQYTESDEGTYGLLPKGTYTPAGGEAVTYDADTYLPLTEIATLMGEGNYSGKNYTRTEVTGGEGTEIVSPDNAITALTQNVAKKVSVLVYLDGNYVGNDDVAATAATSVTGTMNLQFASSANLIPMEYADLHTPAGGNAENDDEDPDAVTYDVELPDAGVTDAANKATKDQPYTFKLATGYTLDTVTVDGTAITNPTPNTDGVYTIPAAQVTGKIKITVTGG